MNPSTTPAGGSATRPRLGLVVALLLAAIYCVGVHLLVVDHTMPALTLLVITAPWLMALASASLTATRRWSTSPTVTAIVVGFSIAATSFCVWRLGRWLSGRVDVLVFAESFVFLLSLTVLFGASLFGDREALITRLARIARGDDMTPAVVRYTRRVTAGWAMFFALAALVSAALFATQSRDLWSAFANLALWPLTALAFGVEYAIRLRVLPDIEHSSPLVGVRTFMHRDDVVVEPLRDAAR